jgi:death-on-curing family protein
LRGRLAELGVCISPTARLLPKGALAKLRKAGVAKVPQPVLGQETIEAGVQELQPEPAFVWAVIGAVRPCQYLSASEVQQIHQALERAFAATPDPIIPPGVRDEGLLESGVHRAETSLGGQFKYPTTEMATAALVHSLIHNHPFFNGNKRAALVSMLVSLDRNGVLLTCSEQDLFRYVLRVAQHRLVPSYWTQLADREVLAISAWIFEHSRAIAKGERPIKWRELRKVLTRWGCTLEGPLPGNKMKVRRVVKRRALFGRTKQQELIFHAWYGGEGREVGPSHLHYLRQSLELDDTAGCDSGYFYGSDPREPDEFIAQYRNVLKRLAKL